MGTEIYTRKKWVNYTDNSTNSIFTVLDIWDQNEQLLKMVRWREITEVVMCPVSSYADG